MIIIIPEIWDIMDSLVLLLQTRIVCVIVSAQKLLEAGF